MQDFKRRFHTTSSAVAVQPKEQKSGVGRRLGRSVTGALTGANRDKNDEDGQGLSAMEKHQQDLVSMAFVIYDTISRFLRLASSTSTTISDLS